MNEHAGVEPQDISDGEREREFGTLFDEAVRRGVGTKIDYNLRYPKHEFLKFLIEKRGVLLHGSNHPDAHELEPHQANDAAKVSGNQFGVYAVDDPIFPIFYAIQVREKIHGSVMSGSTVFDDESGHAVRREYQFSVEPETLAARPWSEGVVYLLSKDGFVQQFEDGKKTDEWVSSAPVKPLAILPVSPEDFPFLSEVKTHPAD